MPGDEMIRARLRWCDRADRSSMENLVARWSMTDRVYRALGERFDTYEQAESYAASMTSREPAGHVRYRFVPMTVATYRRVVNKDGRRVA